MSPNPTREYKFEGNVKYLEFLKSKNFLASATFDHASSKIATKRAAEIQTTLKTESNAKKSDYSLKLRIITTGQDNGRGYTSYLALNQIGGYIPISIAESLTSDKILPDTMVECNPSSILDHYVFISNDGPNLKIVKDDRTFPRLSDTIKTKIKNIDPKNRSVLGVVEATVIEVPTLDDIKNEMNEFVPPESRLLVADDSGTADLVYAANWDSQLDYVKRRGDVGTEVKHNAKTPFKVGDQIQVVGATASMDEEGKPTLVLRQYSSYTRKERSPDKRQRVTLRILSMEKDSGRTRIRFLAIDKFRTFFSGTMDFPLVTDEMGTDKVILCFTEKIYPEYEGNGYDISLSQDEAYIQVIYDDPAIPKLSQLVSKIVDAQKGSLYSSYVIEGRILQVPKGSLGNYEGREFPIFRTIIEDDTGKISPEERDNNYLQDIQLGDRVRIIGAYTFDEEGETKLGLSGFGSIVKI